MISLLTSTMLRAVMPYVWEVLTGYDFLTHFDVMQRPGVREYNVLTGYDFLTHFDRLVQQWLLHKSLNGL